MINRQKDTKQDLNSQLHDQHSSGFVAHSSGNARSLRSTSTANSFASVVKFAQQSNTSAVAAQKSAFSALMDSDSDDSMIGSSSDSSSDSDSCAQGRAKERNLREGVRTESSQKKMSNGSNLSSKFESRGRKKYTLSKSIEKSVKSESQTDSGDVDSTEGNNRKPRHNNVDTRHATDLSPGSITIGHSKRAELEDENNKSSFPTDVEASAAEKKKRKGAEKKKGAKIRKRVRQFIRDEVLMTSVCNSVETVVDCIEAGTVSGEVSQTKKDLILSCLLARYKREKNASGKDGGRNLEVFRLQIRAIDNYGRGPEEIIKDQDNNEIANKPVADLSKVIESERNVNDVSTSSLAIGTEVELIGLIRKTELNGRLGRISSGFKNERYLVSLHSVNMDDINSTNAEKFNVKAANIKVIAKGAQNASYPQVSSSLPFSAGTICKESLLGQIKDGEDNPCMVSSKVKEPNMTEQEGTATNVNEVHEKQLDKLKLIAQEFGIPEQKCQSVAEDLLAILVQASTKDKTNESETVLSSEQRAIFSKVVGENDAHICVSIDSIQSEEINKTVDPLNKDIASNDAGTADSNNTAVFPEERLDVDNKNTVLKVLDEKKSEKNLGYNSLAQNAGSSVRGYAKRVSALLSPASNSTKGRKDALENESNSKPIASWCNLDIDDKTNEDNQKRIIDNILRRRIQAAASLSEILGIAEGECFQALECHDDQADQAADYLIHRELKGGEISSVEGSSIVENEIEEHKIFTGVREIGKMNILDTSESETTITMDSAKLPHQKENSEKNVNEKELNLKDVDRIKLKNLPAMKATAILGPYAPRPLSGQGTSGAYAKEEVGAAGVTEENFKDIDSNIAGNICESTTTLEPMRRLPKKIMESKTAEVGLKGSNYIQSEYKDEHTPLQPKRPRDLLDQALQNIRKGGPPRSLLEKALQAASKRVTCNNNYSESRIKSMAASQESSVIQKHNSVDDVNEESCAIKSRGLIVDNNSIFYPRSEYNGKSKELEETKKSECTNSWDIIDCNDDAQKHLTISTETNLLDRIASSVMKGNSDLISENNNDGLNACDDENLKVSRNVVRVGETPSTERGLESFGWDEEIDDVASIKAQQSCLILKSKSPARNIFLPAERAPSSVAICSRDIPLPTTLSKVSIYSTVPPPLPPPPPIALSSWY